MGQAHPTAKLAPYTAPNPNPMQENWRTQPSGPYPIETIFAKIVGGKATPQVFLFRWLATQQLPLALTLNLPLTLPLTLTLTIPQALP